MLLSRLAALIAHGFRVNVTLPPNGSTARLAQLFLEEEDRPTLEATGPTVDSALAMLSDNAEAMTAGVRPPHLTIYLQGLAKPSSPLDAWVLCGNSFSLMLTEDERHVAIVMTRQGTEAYRTVAPNLIAVLQYGASVADTLYETHTNPEPVPAA